MNLTFRQATTADLPAILNLYGELGEDDGTVLGLDEAARIFARLQLYPDYRIYIALDDDTIIGTFALLIMDNLAHRGARSAILEDVVVAKVRRGQGIGRQMMDFAGKLCRYKGCYKMALNSNKRRTEAHRFYETLGFEQHGVSYAMDKL